MNSTYASQADLGATTGHGPIEYEGEGVVFHHDWESRAFALTLAAGAPGGWNIDMSRSVREVLPNYLDLTYYEIWTAALEQLVVDHGLVTTAEVEAGHALGPGDASRRVLRAEAVPAVLTSGGPASREPGSSARFEIGDRVRTRADRVDHHTRLPAYVSGQVGVVARVHGVHVFPDTNARGLGEHPQWLYTVVFDAADLWDDAAPGQRVSVDAWDSYLEPAR